MFRNGSVIKALNLLQDDCLCAVPGGKSVPWGDSMTNGQRSGDRDLRILQAFAEGAPVEELAVRFGLSRERVGTIIRAERLKVEVSPLPEYRALRTALKL
jgi:Mor family transcriptional regulator